MLPQFNEDGNLPEGIHRASEPEVITQFALSSAKRQWLGARLQDLLASTRATGKLERAFVWGSFVSTKDSPQDLDVLLVMAADFDVDSLSEEQRVPFDHTRAKLRFSADVFWTTSAVGINALALLLDTYQTTKDFKRRGIVEVVSHD